MAVCTNLVCEQWQKIEKYSNLSLLVFVSAKINK